MECPFCTASLPEEDLFCEACGKPLQTPRPATAAAGCPCGAPAEEIDEEGYCGRCGHLSHRPPSDHMELVLSDDFAGVTDRGVKHQRNEDRFAMRQVGNAYVLVVCDGVSSSTQPQLASSSVTTHVAEALEASLRRHSASSPERTVRTAIQAAQARLETESAAADDPPSTTVVAALVKGRNVTLGWAGDSRAYWIDASGETLQLTADHSWMNEVVASGEMNLQEAARSPKAHGITHWLGADAGENAQPEVSHFTIPGAGHLLLCSDGLWNYAQEPQQISALLEPAEVIDIARRMIEYANQQGGHDNITAVLLRFPAIASAH